MSVINWTEQQLGVIGSVDNNTLVSASAGSGKTTVMLERVLRLITGESGKAKTPLRRIVMVTFNDSVAAELKNKINARLAKEIAESADKDYLRKQIEDIPLADISTIHSFCSTIVKNNFEYLELQPSFSIVDENEKEILFGKAIANVMKEYKENYDYQMDILINYFGGEKGFYSTIAKAYAFLEAQLDREACLTQLAFSCYDGDFKNSKLAIDYTYALRRECGNLLAEGEKKRNYFKSAGMDKRCDHISVTLEYIGKIAESKDIEELTEVVAYAPEIKAVPTSKKDDDVDRSVGEDYKAFNEACKKVISKLKSVFPSSYAELQRDIDKNRNYLARFVDVLKRVWKEYAALKKKENKLDFADLEYYAVKALQNDEIASELSKRYDYVCVDEYQDVNAVQEYILSRISNGRNTFMVGDVKQSIYKFRMTDPQIFLDKYRRYQADGSLGDSFCLNSNYRSCREVIDFVNEVFDVIMTKDFGGIDYCNESRLTLGNTDYLPQEGRPVRIVNFAKEDKDLQSPVGEDGVYSVRNDIAQINAAPSKEGAYIAKIIKDLVGKKEIQAQSTDGGLAYRKIRYSDIALLCAKRSDGVERIVSTLKSEGIPIDSANILQEKENFCIGLMTAFIKVLDNHRQDIPLVEVLTSSVFAQLSYRDMAIIRQAYKDENFFHRAADRYSREKEDIIAQRLNEFFKTLSFYRSAASFMSVGALIRRLIMDFDFKAYMTAIDGGAREFSGLERFVRSLEGKSYNGSISSFVEAMENSVDFGKVSQEAGLAGECVVTDTIHKSKGLEYPIVFLVDAAKQVNLSDVNTANAIFDKSYGFAIKNINEEERFYDDSLPVCLMRSMKGEEYKQEYMRLFYVAVTRARNMLFITSTGGLGKHEFGERKVNSPRSMLDWLNNVAAADRRFLQKYYDGEVDIQEDKKVVEYTAPQRALIGNESTKDFERSLGNFYAFKSSTSLLVKHTVTAVNNAYYEANVEDKRFKEYDEMRLLDTYKDGNVFDDENMEVRSYSDEGIAYHRVLELIDFDCFTIDDVVDKMDDMVKEGTLSQAQKNAVDPSSIFECLQSDVMRQARKHPHYRERQFMLNLPARDILDVDSDDRVLLQGTVDLFVNGGDGENILVDFKYSRKSPSRVKERYKKQLDLYAMAIEECLGVKVDRKVIFMLGKNIAIDV